MWSFFLMILIHLILMPFKIIISLILNFLWFPGFIYDKNLLKETNLDINLTYKKAFDSLNETLSKIELDGDGAKMIGILYEAIKDEDIWKSVKKFWYKNYFVRYPNTELEKVKNESNFSGDMISGMLLAIWIRYKEKKLTEDEIKQLKEIWENTCFCGKSLQFKHPFQNKVDRGFLYKWSGLGFDALQSLSFLAVGYEIFKDFRYKLMYWILKITNYPILFFSDMAIFLGKFYALSWYDEHSNQILNAVGYECTKDKIFKRAAKKLIKRYPFNAAVLGFYYKYFEKNEDIKNEALMWLKNYKFEYKQSEYEIFPDEWMKNYFSITSFKTKPASKYILPLQFRGGQSDFWEKKALSYEPPQEGGRKYYVDYLSLYNLLK